MAIQPDAPLGRPALSTEQLLLIEAKIANEKKSALLAYALWFFLGLFGIHNYYLARPMLATFQLLGGLIALGFILASEWSIGIILLVVWGLSFIADLFFIPSRVRAYSERLREEYARQMQ